MGTESSLKDYPVNNEPSPRTEAVAYLLSCFVVVVAALLSPETYPISLVLAGYTVAVGGAVVMISARPAHALRGFLPAFVFVLVQYLSGIWGVNTNAALSYSFMFSILVLFSLTVRHSCEFNGPRGLFRVIAAVVAVVSIYGIYQYLLGFERTAEIIGEQGLSSLGLKGGDTGGILYKLGYKRVFSTFMSPNVFASYLSCSLPLVGYMALTAAGRKGRIIFGLCAALGIVAILLTRSAGGFLALASAVLMFVILKAVISDRVARRRILLVAGAAIVLFSVLGFGIYKTRTGGALGVEKSLAERMSYWKGAAELAAGRPVTGYGSGSFSVKYLGYLPEGGTESRYAHNVVLQTLAETGVVGLLALAWLFASFFRRVARGLLGSEDPLLYTAIAACGTAFLVHNMTDFTFYLLSGSVPFWLSYGVLSAGPVRSAGGAQPDEITSRKGVNAVVRVFGIVIVIVFVFNFAIAHVARQRVDHAVRLLDEAGIGSSARARNVPPPDKALELAESAVSLKPYDDGMHAFLAGLYEGSAYKFGPKFVRMAEKEYEKAIELNPEYPYHYRDLGILYMKTGNKDLARLNFSKALSLYPGDPNLRELKENSES